MLKVAMLATVVLATVSTGAVEKTFAELGAAPAPASCRLVLARACPPRALDVEGAVAAPAVDADGFSWALPPDADWSAEIPEPDIGLDFKSAATEPRTVLLGPIDRDRPQQLIPALFALGALLILLRKRPG